MQIPTSKPIVKSCDESKTVSVAPSKLLFESPDQPQHWLNQWREVRAGLDYRLTNGVKRVCPIPFGAAENAHFTSNLGIHMATASSSIKRPYMCHDDTKYKNIKPEVLF